MKIKLTYSAYCDNSEYLVDCLSFDMITETFEVKEKVNGAYLLENGWFVDYKYSPESSWEIYKGEEYITYCDKPIEL